MGKKEVMDCLERGEILSTFSGCPIASAAAMATLDVLEQENISERSQRLGELLTKTLRDLAPPYILEHRGGGLFHTLVLDESKPSVTARRVAALATMRGVLVGCGFNRLRLSPPLTITEDDLVKGIEIIAQALRDVETIGDFPGSTFIN